MTEDEVEDETVDEAGVQIGGGERHFLEDTMNEKKTLSIGGNIRSDIGQKLL